MATVKILVGSVYGNAQQLAEDCAGQLERAGHAARLLAAGQIEEVAGAETEALLVVTSTTGQGEIPDNLLPLYCQLQERLPLLPAVRYGVIALGDSSYDDFAEAGRMMDNLLAELQARRLQPTLFIDACETMDPEAAAATWLDGWAARL